MINKIIKRWTRLLAAFTFLGRGLAVNRCLLPPFKKVLGKYVNMQVVEEILEVAEKMQAERDLERHVQQAIETGAKATSSIEWMEGSAPAGLTLGANATDLSVDLIEDVLEEGGLGDSATTGAMCRRGQAGKRQVHPHAHRGNPRGP